MTALLLVATLVATPGQAQTRPNVELMPWQVVEHITSGAVIDVRGIGLVRLAGIEDAGELSRAFLSGMVSSQPVRVVPTAHSSQGMTHALVYLPDGRCVNVEMLRFGYARARVEPGFDRAEEFHGLESDARRLKRGLWAPAPSTAVAVPPRLTRASDSGDRTFHVAMGGGAALTDDGERWYGAIEVGAAFSRAFSLYVHAAHLNDAGEPFRRLSWAGSAGFKLSAPSRLLRPYLRAGGGYVRLEASDTVHDEPFWEAGAGLMIGGGAFHFDAGYTFMRLEQMDVARAFGLLGVRF